MWNKDRGAPSKSLKGKDSSAWWRLKKLQRITSSILRQKLLTERWAEVINPHLYVFFEICRTSRINKKKVFKAIRGKEIFHLVDSGLGAGCRSWVTRESHPTGKGLGCTREKKSWEGVWKEGWGCAGKPVRIYRFTCPKAHPLLCNEFPD